MLKKLTLFVIAFTMIAIFASPAYAMLKVLEPELSEELKGIAAAHLAESKNLDSGAITIEYAWVRQFFGINVDVYMVDAIVNKGLANEEKLQVYVRVDTKTVLDEAELAALQEEDAANAPAEPVARIMTAQIDPVKEDEALDPDTPVSSDNTNLEAPVGNDNQDTEPSVGDNAQNQSAQEVTMNPIAEIDPIAENVLANNSYFYVAGAVLAAAALIGVYILIKRRV